MQRFYFSLAISASDYLPYYQGTVTTVVVRAHDGRKVSFPAAHLRRFVTANGVQGQFCMTVNDQLRFVSLERTQSFK